MRPDLLLTGSSWQAARTAARRQDGFDVFGGSGPDFSVLTDPNIDEAAAGAASSISDVLRSGGAAAEVAWGSGAQDAIVGADPILGNPNSISDRLRGLAAIGETADVNNQEQLIVGSGGGPFVAVADPSVDTGTVDWTKVLAAVPQSVTAAAGAVATVTNAFAALAGVRNRTVVGNPAPGGTVQPSYLQRLLGTGGSSAPAAGAPLQAQAVGSLATLAIVAGIGYLLVKGARRR